LDRGRVAPAPINTPLNRQCMEWRRRNKKKKQTKKKGGDYREEGTNRQKKKQKEKTEDILRGEDKERNCSWGK
jgi:hypothetical protein